MDSIQVKGVVYQLKPIKEVSATFKSQTVVVKYEDKFPQYYSVEFTQHRVEQLAKVKEGDSVCVWFNLRGKNYFDKRTNEEKFFNKLDGWKIDLEKLDNNLQDDLLNLQDVQTNDTPKVDSNNVVKDSDLPF